MISRTDLHAAIRYNSKQAGSLYNVASLPWPWSWETSDSGFAWAVALFQSQNKMVIDGKLGMKTLTEMSNAQKRSDNTPLERPILKQPWKSNCLIIDGARVQLPESLVEVGFSASNYLDDDEPHFRRRNRVRPLSHFVLHETAGSTAEGCKRTLIKKKYGVQLILAPSGDVSCHGDLIRDVMTHANQLNKTSVGIEVVNPYSPKYAKPPWGPDDEIPAQWWTWIPKGGPKKYLKPTSEQMVVIRILVPWLCDVLSIPYVFPTADLGPRNRKIKGWDSKPRAVPAPGVVCHGSFSGHSDGWYMQQDLIGRAKRGES